MKSILIEPNATQILQHLIFIWKILSKQSNLYFINNNKTHTNTHTYMNKFVKV